MKVFLTGASGGLGQHLLRYLVIRGNYEIKVLVHNSTGDFSGCSTVKGDLLDSVSLVEATKGMDMVVHLAALTHSNRREEYFRVNVDGTKNLLEACATNGVQRFIHVSSGAAHLEGGDYSVSKLRSEEIVKNSGVPWVIFRPSEVYGPNSPDAINKLIKWIQGLAVVPVIGDGQYFLSPAYIDDVISVIGQCAFAPEMAGKILVVSGPEEMTYTELVDRICRFLHIKRLKVFIPVVLAKALVEILALLGGKFLVRDQIPRLLCDKSSRLDPVLKPPNYHPRRLEQGLSQCLGFC